MKKNLLTSAQKLWFKKYFKDNKLAGNYEQFLHTAQIMAEFACMILLLKHI